jgi:hypothetical protein
MKRQLQQFNYSNEFNPKKQCSKRRIFFWTQELNITLVTIENDNPLSIIKETTITF